jgi:hypothetical protein
MPDKGWENLPDHDVGDAANRFDVDGFRAQLFGGPAATLYGDSNVPSQSSWDSTEIPKVGPADSAVSSVNNGGFWGTGVDLFADTGSHDSGFHHTGTHHTGVHHTGIHHTGIQDTGSQVSPPAQQESSLVRAYAKTRGKTRPDYDLAIEALVSTSERGRSPEAATQQEHLSICGLCMDTRSVAEIAVHMRLPLGAAKVLIGDMAGLGLVVIHQSGMVVGDRPSVEFMERVLSGLRRL